MSGRGRGRDGRGGRGTSSRGRGRYEYQGRSRGTSGRGRENVASCHTSTTAVGLTGTTQPGTTNTNWNTSSTNTSSEGSSYLGDTIAAKPFVQHGIPMDVRTDTVGHGVAVGLFRTLQSTGIQFIRYFSVDICNTPRCKVVPIKFLVEQHQQQQLNRNNTNNKSLLLEPAVAISQVCFGGMPPYDDVIVNETGYTAQYSLPLQPDLSTIRILPYITRDTKPLGPLSTSGLTTRDGTPTTAIVMCNLLQPINISISNSNSQAGTKSVPQYSELCCRSLLRQLVDYIGNEHNAYITIGAEIEFTLYDSVSNEPINSKNFANTTTLNRQQHFIQALYDNIERQDIQIELIHSESLNGQLEIVLRYVNDPVIIVDQILLAKETIETLAYQHQLKALFLPKINPNQAGNGIHFHISLYDKTTNRNIFTTEQSNSQLNNSDISLTMITPIGGSFIEGILQQLPTLIAFTIPTPNSFRRIGPGCWTGCSADWDYEDKECPIRLINSFNGMCERFEYRLCDMTSNLYLSLSAICIAGIDGIQRQLELRPSKAEGGRCNHDDDTGSGSDVIPKSVPDALTLLENNQLYQRTMSSSLLRAYIALRRNEYMKTYHKSLAEDVAEALSKA
jgi:glutamine synthetase